MEQTAVMKVLHWAYEKAVEGVGATGSAEDLAQEYLKGPGTLNERADELIRWQNIKCGGAGFISGLGGVMTLPVAIPANISSVLYMQIRMVAAIACMGGYDVRDDKVKTVVLLCLCGSAATEMMKDFGVRLGQHLSRQLLARLSTQVVQRTQQRVGARLAAKLGEKGLAAVGRGIPLVGALVGGTLDALATYAVGEVAKRAFLQEEEVLASL